jgi:hypothetical protein
MKKLIILIVVGVALKCGQSVAQTVDTTTSRPAAVPAPVAPAAKVATAPPLTFDNLKLNSSPAFVLLGVEPDNIQRPSSPSQFVAGLQNAVVDGKLQPNVAFEISPYYLFSSKKSRSDPKKDEKQFNASYYLLDKPGLAKTIAKTLSISFGTSETDKTVFGNLKSGTGLGLGLRFQLVSGKPAKNLKKWNDAFFKHHFYKAFAASVKYNSATVFNYKNVSNKAVEDFKTYVDSAEFNTLSEQDVQYFLKNAMSEINSKVESESLANNKDRVALYIETLDKVAGDEYSKRLDSLNSGKNPLTKQGFILEFAAGQALVFQDNNYNDVALAKTAIWLTPSWRWDASNANSDNISLIDAMGVVRYTFNNQDAHVDVADYLDLGVKGAFTQNRWSGSLEYVNRRASKLPTGQQKKYTYKLTVGLDYKLTDAITFKFTFGTNFDGNTATYTDPKKMFAVGGLNFGIFGLNKSGTKQDN